MSITFTTVYAPKLGKTILICYNFTSNQVSEDSNQQKKFNSRIQECVIFIFSIFIWPLTCPIGFLGGSLFTIGYLNSAFEQRKFKRILLKTNSSENNPNLEACEKTCQKFLESKRKELVKDTIQDLKSLALIAHWEFPSPEPRNLPQKFYAMDFLNHPLYNSINNRRILTIFRHLQTNKINIQSIDRQLEMLKTAQNQQELREKIRNIADIHFMGCTIEKEKIKEFLYASIAFSVPAGLYLYYKFNLKRWIFGEDKRHSIADQYNRLMRETNIEWIPGDLKLTKS